MIKNRIIARKAARQLTASELGNVNGGTIAVTFRRPGSERITDADVV